MGDVPIKRVAERLIDLKVSVEADVYSSVHEGRDEMPLGPEDDPRPYLGRALALVLSAGLLTADHLNPAVAHEHEEMCGPVIDGDGEAVVQSDGDILMHSSSFPCPPKEVTAEPAAIEPTQPNSVAVYFDFDVDVPNAAGDEALLRIITNLESLSPRQVNLSGHADRAGTEVYNQDLSQRRADNVAKRLIAGGIEASKIKIDAFGEIQPAVPTEDGVREPANRRAVVDLDF